MGKDEFSPAYIRPKFDLGVLPSTAFVMYSKPNDFKVLDESKIEVLAYNESPYFNRTHEHFSSHQHTPNNPDIKKAGVVKSGNVIYCPFFLFSDYSSNGEITNKYVAIELIKNLLGDRLVESTLPVPGIITLREKDDKSAKLLHLLYGSAVKRANVEVIEDIPVLATTSITLKDSNISKVIDTDSGEELPFSKIDSGITFDVLNLDCHKIIELK